MKVSKETAAAHRAAMVKAAGRLFRERGFDKVGVAEITRAAGLTHGGFYGHFDSKEALAAEACGAVFDVALNRLPGAPRAVAPDLAGFLDSYLTERHRDRSADGCPMTAFAGDMPRQDAALQAPFGAGLDAYLAKIEALLPEDGARDGKSRRDRAIALVSALVGGLALSRATAKSAPALSAEILAALRRELAEA
jgi:TetR/AcrR family transcriptional repressor of nem operon